MHLLNLKSSDGHDCAVPVRLPDAITFDVFIPGRGILRGGLHSASLDPAEAEVGEVEVWDPKTLLAPIALKGPAEDAALEQAGDVLGHVVDRLTSPNLTGLYPGSEQRRCPVLRAIADLAHHEACAWEAWEALPEAVRRETRGVRPTDPSADTAEQRPCVAALAAYIEVLVGEAQEAATKAARARETAAILEACEERAAQLRAGRTDAAIDAAKDGR